MIAINITNLSYSVGDRDILDHISFALDARDKLGIIGVNGCGKTTLLRLITSELEPTEGQIFRAKDKTIAWLRQDASLPEDSTRDGDTPLKQMYKVYQDLFDMEERMQTLVRDMERSPDSHHMNTQRATEYASLEDAYTKAGGHEMRARCVSTLQNLGFTEKTMNEPISNLSGGERTRLALGLTLARQPDILLLDEPTNHLDIGTTTWLENYLAKANICLLVISHDRYFLDKITNKTLLIRRGRAKLYNGNYTRSMAQRKADDDVAEHQFKVQQKEIARQEAYIEQQKRWGRERNIIAAESRQKMLDKMVLLSRPDKDPTPIRMAFTQGLESGNDVLQVRNLSVGYGDKPIFENISFKLSKGEHMLIIGPNGCGKSTLIKTVMGQIRAQSGAVYKGVNVEIGYYDQQNQNLNPNNTVLEELWEKYPTMTETHIRSALAAFRFTGEDVFKPVSVLSGGERARLTLSKLILSHMNLLILDEPTNHLDVDSREALESALSSFEGTILAVSHDRYFIEKIATRIFEMRPESILGMDYLDYPANHPGAAYTEYQTYKTARIEERTAQPGTPSSAAPVRELSSNKEQYLKNKQSASEARKRATLIGKLSTERDQIESRLDEITSLMAGEAATDYIKIAELDNEKTNLETRLLEIYEQLEELETT